MDKVKKAAALIAVIFLLLLKVRYADMLRDYTARAVELLSVGQPYREQVTAVGESLGTRLEDSRAMAVLRTWWGQESRG